MWKKWKSQDGGREHEGVRVVTRPAGNLPVGNAGEGSSRSCASLPRPLSSRWPILLLLVYKIKSNRNSTIQLAIVACCCVCWVSKKIKRFGSPSGRFIWHRVGLLYDLLLVTTNSTGCTDCEQWKYHVWMVISVLRHFKHSTRLLFWQVLYSFYRARCYAQRGIASASHLSVSPWRWDIVITLEIFKNCFTVS